MWRRSTSGTRIDTTSIKGVSCARITVMAVIRAHDLYRGAAASPVLLHVPHAGLEVPGWARGHLLPDDADLAAEQAALTDHLTDRIALCAAAAAPVRPWVLVNRVSRFVVDPERFPDEREEMAAVGMAAVYTHDTHGRRIRADDAAHRDELLAAYYATWADAVADLADARLAATGRAVLIDVHSYPSTPLPYELHADGPRPAVCLGTDPAHTPPDLIAAAERAFAQVGEVGTDSPFGGSYVPLRHHGTDLRVRSVMVELRRDRHLVEPAGPVTAGFAVAARALAALVDAVTC
jgi:N-formylglutamate amidohydrolase